MRQSDAAPQPIEQPGGYLAPREAASYLSISSKQLEHYRRRGGGPRYAKFARMVRYPRAELDRWMSEHLVAATCQVPGE